jgi:glutathione S-transferase
MFFAAAHVQPWMSVLGQQRILRIREGRAPDASLVSHAERELDRFLPVLEERLASCEYLSGRYSIADIAVGCGFEGAEERGVRLRRYARIDAWRTRLRARPAWSD